MGNGGSIVLRSARPPEQMENALRSTVHALDPVVLLLSVAASMLPALRAASVELMQALRGE